MRSILVVLAVLLVSSSDARAAKDKLDYFSPRKIVTDGPAETYNTRVENARALIPSVAELQRLMKAEKVPELLGRMEIIAGQADALWKKLEAGHFTAKQVGADPKYRRRVAADWRWGPYTDALHVAAMAHAFLCDRSLKDPEAAIVHCKNFIDIWLGKPGVKFGRSTVWTDVVRQIYDDGSLEFEYAYMIRQHKFSRPGAGYWYFALLSAACDKGHKDACNVVNPSEEDSRRATEILLRHRERQ